MRLFLSNFAALICTFAGTDTDSGSELSLGVKPCRDEAVDSLAAAIDKLSALSLRANFFTSESIKIEDQIIRHIKTHTGDAFDEELVALGGRSNRIRLDSRRARGDVRRLMLEVADSIIALKSRFDEEGNQSCYDEVVALEEAHRYLDTPLSPHPSLNGLYIL